MTIARTTRGTRTAQPRLGALALRRMGGQARWRRLALAVVAALALVTAVHHLQPEGTMGGMPGMHSDPAAMMCIGTIACAALLVLHRRGGFRRPRLPRLVGWAPRLPIGTLSAVPRTRLAPIRDGPRIHLRLQVIRR